MQKTIWVEGELLQRDDEHGVGIPMPSDYIVGTPILAKMHWMPTNANHGSVCWYLYHTGIPFDWTFPPQEKIMNLAPTAGRDRDYLVNVVGNLPGLSNVDGMYRLRVLRDENSNDDTYVGEAVLLGVSLHYDWALV